MTVGQRDVPEMTSKSGRSQEELKIQNGCLEYLNSHNGSHERVPLFYCCYCCSYFGGLLV